MDDNQSHPELIECAVECRAQPIERSMADYPVVIEDNPGFFDNVVDLKRK